MSIYKINPTDYQSVTVSTSPSRYYSSSSSGVTGSVYVFARRSNIEKEITPLSSFVEATHNDADLSTALENIVKLTKSKNNAIPGSVNISGQLEDFLKKVNQQSISAKKQKVLDIIRFTPSFDFTSNTVRKDIIRQNLSHHYRSTYPSAHWAYSNYHCLNFFSSSTVPTSSVLLYPNDDDGTIHKGYAYGRYIPSSSFSFDFYINPRYKDLDSKGHFKAGTIFHLSSSYALSLITGSLKDVNGLPQGFRLQLQLSQSADVPPSLANPGIYPQNLTFRSDDNSLLWNHWHRVVVRWGTNIINHGTGSFNIDGLDKGIFVVPSGTIAPLVFPDNVIDKTNPDVLCVGNYYEGKNSGNDKLKYFFSTNPAKRDGVYQLVNDNSFNEGPDVYYFNHPLQAEVHDLTIKKYYVSDVNILMSGTTGPQNIGNDVAFYLPPFFVEKTPLRSFVNDHGGILQTPFFEIDGTTADPFNLALSFGVGGHYINTENFLKDFASGHFPRQHHMTGVAIDTTTAGALSANEYLYDQPFVRRRNLLVMPCDDGNFYPNVDLLLSEPLQGTYFDDLGNYSPGFISLIDMLSTSSLIFNTSFHGTEASGKTADEANFFVNESLGITPENPAATPGPVLANYIKSVAKAINENPSDQGLEANAPLAIYQRTRDASSNQVTFFDISNLYYGLNILPGSFMIRDSALTGSGGKIGITLKDDGLGTIYRADSITPNSTWNSVGTIFYNEGIIAIKSPHLYFFGKDGFEVSFKGQQNIHVLRFDITAPMNHLNSSSNPTFISTPSSIRPNEPDSNFVYITGINFHDDNLNVVMKTQLAQPIMKRHSDKIGFKVKYDW
jgi:hypothetical protein